MGGCASVRVSDVAAGKETGDFKRLPSFSRNVTAENGEVRILSTFVAQICLDYHSRHTAKLTKPVSYTFPGALLFVDISGFTSLNEALADLPGGVEQVSKSISAYFSRIIAIVQSYGGDVLKFAGDALICLFMAASTDGSPVEAWEYDDMTNELKKTMYQTVSARAIRCGLHVQVQCGKQTMFGTVLRLHCGVVSGDLVSLHLGGHEGQWEHIVSGDAMRVMSDVLDAAGSGELCTNADTFLAVEGHFRGVYLDNGIYRVVDQVIGPNGQPPSHDIIHKEQASGKQATLHLSASMTEAVKSYVPSVVHRMLESLHSPDGDSLNSGFRQVSVIFAMLPTLRVDTSLSIHGVSKIQEAFVLMQKTVRKFDGFVRQFLEDDKGIVLIAVWGVAPHFHDNDSYRAVCAATAMHTALKEKSSPTAIGVTSGVVFCGNVGCASRREFAVVGHVVNMAARIMGKAKANCDVYCDVATHDLCEKHGMKFEPLPPVKLKGMTEEQPIFRPIKDLRLQPYISSNNRLRSRSTLGLGVAARDDTNLSLSSSLSSSIGSFSGLLSPSPTSPLSQQQQQNQQLLTPNSSAETTFIEKSKGSFGAISSKEEERMSLIGRDHDKAKLLSAIDSLTSSTKVDTSVVFIEGDAGIGKSALLRTGLLYAEEKWNECIHIFATQANSVDIDESYFVFKPLFVSLLCDVNDESRKMEDVDLRDALLTCLRGHECFEDWLPLMSVWNGLINGLRFDVQPAIASMSFDARRKVLHAMMIHMLALPSTAVILAVDDAHFLDPSSWALIHDIATLSSSSHHDHDLLLVLCMRPFKVPPQYSEVMQLPSTLRLQLAPMSSAAVAAVVSQMFGVSQLPKAVVSIINKKATGNPFFGGELVKMLIDKKMLAIENNTCQLTEDAEESLDQLELPTSIQGTIIPRFDELHHEQQLILRVACCLGVDFQSQYVWQIYPVCSDIAQFKLHLSHLVRVGMIREALRSGTLRQNGTDERFAADYTFKHPMIKDTVYSCMPHQSRQDLHRRCALFYDHHFQQNRPWARLATHYYQAVGGGDDNTAREVARMDFGLFTRALEVTVVAGDIAFEKINYTQAVELYEKALDLLRFLPNNRGDATEGARELELLLKMLVPMMQIKGFDAKETAAIFERASSISSHLRMQSPSSESATLKPGQLVTMKSSPPTSGRNELVKGKTKASYSVSDAMRQLEIIYVLLISHQRSPVEAGERAAQLLNSVHAKERTLGLSLHFASFQALGSLHIGDFSKARARVLAVLQKKEYYEQACLELPAWTPFNAGASCHSIAAISSLHLGDRAMHNYHFGKALSITQKTDNRFHLAELYAKHGLHLALYGDIDTARQIALRGCELAHSENFGHPKRIADFTAAYTKFLPTVYDMELLQGTERLVAKVAVEESFAAMQAAHANDSRPIFLYPLLLEACFRMGKLDQAQEVMNKWFESAQSRHEFAFMGEYHIWSGELMLRLGQVSKMEEVIQCYQRAEQLAGEQKTPIVILKSLLNHCCAMVDLGSMPSQDMIMRLLSVTDSVEFRLYDSAPEGAGDAKTADVDVTNSNNSSELLVVGLVRAFFDKLDSQG